jgi:polyisoprenoid-binding protein YceI
MAKTRIIACLGLAAVALSAGAGVAANDSSEDGEPWLSGEFTVDPYHTFTHFAYDHFELATGRGRFDDTTGQITLSEDGKVAAIDISIAVDSLDTGVELLDQRLKSNVFFDAETYPSIRFQSNDVRYEDGILVAVTGDLTIKDVTKSVTLDVTRSACKKERNPTLKYPACGADASLVIERSNFGVGAFAPLVSDRIEISIAVEAIKGADGIEAQFQRFRD